MSEGSIIGWIHAFVAFRVQSDCFVEIGGLVVKQKFHKKGIGKTFVNRVEQWASSKNLNSIRVRCNTIRTSGYQFYHNIGFDLNKEQKVFDKKLVC